MKVMKRTFYALTALLLLAAFFGGAAAAAEQSITIDVPSTEVPWNEKTTVPVTIHNPVDIEALTLKPTAAEGVTVSVNGTKTPIGGTIGPKGFTWYSTNGLNSDTVLCYLDIVPDVSKPVTTVTITVDVSELCDGKHADLISSYPVKPATLKIQKAPSIATYIEIQAPTAASLAYGAEGTAVAVVKDQYGDEMDAEITWTATAGIKVDASGNYKVVNAAAGSATITATVGDISDKVSVTLTKGTLTADDFVKIEESYEWGSPIAVTIKAKDGITGYGDITVYYDGKTDVPTDVGTYAVTISVSAGDNYAGVDGLEVGTVTISPKSLADAVIEATAVTYNGEAQTPEFTVTLGDKTLTADTDYTLDVEGGIAAGDYTVTVTGKGNYEGTASDTWTIAKAVPTAEMISCKIPNDLVYTGESQTLTASVKAGIYGLGAVTLMYNGAEAAVDAGDYAVTANVAEGTNYTAAADLAIDTLTIGKADLYQDDFTLSATSAEYNGKPQEVTVAPKVDGVDVTAIKYKGDANAPSAKGTYTITISATGGKNYNDVTDLVVGTFVITGRQVAEPEITGTYAYTGSELTAVIAESADYEVTGNKATAAGTHIVVVSLTDKDNTAWKNGGTDNLELEWVIVPKSIIGASVTTSPETDAFTYDGIVKNPTFIVTDGTMTIAETDYIIKGDVSSAAAGKHQVTIEGQNNYTGYIDAEWNIAPAIPTIDDIVFTIPTRVVYGQTYEVTANAAEGVVGLGAITLLYNGTATAPVNAGTYLVNASIAAGTNYTAAEIYLGNLVIAKATPVAANITCVMEDVVYDGKEHALSAKAADGVVGLGAIKLLYNDVEAAPVANSTYVVKAEIAEGDNYAAATVELGTFNITKATLTADDFTFTPALPVSYDEGTAEAVVVTVKEGIFGNGSITVKYGDSTDVPTTEGTYKVNATFAVGANYTAAEFYLGDMTIVKKVAPEFNINFVVNPTNVTITGDYAVNADNTTTITDSSSGVVLSIKFADYETDGSKIIGNISKVNATYPEINAASPKDGEFKYGLVINLGNNLTNALPAISSVYDEAVAGKVKPSGKTFEGLVMIGAEDVDDVNAAIKAGKGDVKLTFKIPKSAVPADKKNNIVVYHVSGDKFTKTSASAVTEDDEFYIIVATGNGFSSYVAGIETTTPTTGGSTTGSSGGSSSKPSTTPVTPPADDPSDEPSDDPSDVPGSDIPEIPPVEPSEPGKSPAPIAGMILGALAAAAVLRRK